MPSVFVYEFVTARRLGEAEGSPLHSLYVEGRAMRDAVAADFAAVPGVSVISMPADVPDGRQQAAFRECAKRADWSFIVAPETGGELEHLAREVLVAGGKLLGPSPDAIAQTGDKLLLSRLWFRHRVPHITTFPADDRPSAFPVVLKPRDGAGSEDTVRIDTREEYEDAIHLGLGSGSRIVQPFTTGTPVSVAFLIGPPPERTVLTLPPTYQRLSDDGRFKYLGGELPLPVPLADRATRLARRALECVRGLFGHLGVDLILGDADDGSEDVAVEINPRLTTSYVGLRAAAEQNLAELLLKLAAGTHIEPTTWKPGSVSWTAAGAVTTVPAAGTSPPVGA